MSTQDGAPGARDSGTAADSTGIGGILPAPREIVYFLLMTQQEQAVAIRRLASQGMSDTTLATATRLSVEQIRRIIAEPTKGPPE